MKAWRALLCSFSLLALSACDPRTAIYKMFTDQGLNLLKPSRSYIAIGGIVVVPKHGRPQYLDPYDSIPPATGNTTNFQAVVDSEQDKSADAVTATTAISGVVPLPVGFKFSSGQAIQLDQINATGVRYTTQMIDSLLQKDATKSAVAGLLTPDNHVYVIQEVYSATSLSVKSASNVSLAASYGGSATIPQCQSPSLAGSPSSSSSASDAGSGNSKQAAASEASNATANTSTKSGSSATLGQAAGGTSPAAGKTTNKGGATAVAVGVCRISESTLAFTSSAPTPFAVRLNEVGRSPGGVLSTIKTGFHLPSAALGDQEQVENSALVSPIAPVLQQLLYRGKTR